MPSGDKAAIGAVITLLVLLFLARGEIAMSVQAVSDDPAFTRWDPLFKKYGRQYGVPWRWLKAICMIESSLGQARSVARGLAAPTDVEGSKSGDGKSWGLMQTTLATSRALEGYAIQAPYLNDPDNSVRLAAKLVKQLIARYSIKDPESVARDYNGGPKKGPLTLAYWAKFQANLAIVMQKQPGVELEGYL